MKTYKLFIDGKWANSSSKKTITSYDPATGKPAATIALMIVRGVIKKKGTLKLELDVPPKPLYKDLKKKGLNLRKRIYYK